MAEELTCFKSYDVRGEIGSEINESIAYRIGRAVAQHFNAKSIVVGFDARETSPRLALATMNGGRDAGSDVISIGLAGTEEMYCAVSTFGACAGIEVTASHNPINYNGMKIVKSFSRPLNIDKEFLLIKKIAENQKWIYINKKGSFFDKSEEARNAYVSRILNLVDVNIIKPLKIVVNSGNGAAGPTFDAIAKRLTDVGVPLEFERVHHLPDASFPNGIPNPLLSSNHAATSDIVRAVKADFGIAFDGDFDRCFFFDELGNFVSGEYIIGLLAEVFLKKEARAKIVHDPRVIWNTKDIVHAGQGVAIQSKTGHAFIKQAMRRHDAVYGGEISAHHYFRDFYYCDSGMIPWLLVSELISRKGRSLRALVSSRVTAYPSSGEKNFCVDDPDRAIQRVIDEYLPMSPEIDRTDGVSLAFEKWRFNLRCSNTEPVVRLNIESKGDLSILKKNHEIISNILSVKKFIR